MKIYIAGPMRGIPYFNFPAFDRAKKYLENIGHAVVSPADIDRENGFDPINLGPDYDWEHWDGKAFGFSLQETIDRDLKALKECDAIFMLEGWENSRGARAEKALAEWMGLIVTYDKPPEEDVLEEALRITKGDRQNSYGPPEQDFARTAELWNVLLSPFVQDGELNLPPRAVAMAMITLKLSRETHQIKRDNAVDIAGYSRCMHLCQKAEVKKDVKEGVPILVEEWIKDLEIPPGPA